MSNLAAVRRAQRALDAYKVDPLVGRDQYINEPDRSVLVDLLADLRHWTDAKLEDLREDDFDDDDEVAEAIWSYVSSAALMHHTEELDWRLPG